MLGIVFFKYLKFHSQHFLYEIKMLITDKLLTQNY